MSPKARPTTPASSSSALPTVVGGGGGVGNLACVYAYVGPDADVKDVAKDLRRHGPTILMLCCANEQKASSVREQLELPAQSAVAEPKTRPAAQQSKKADSRPEVQYRCVQFDKLVVGGRVGIVAQVSVKEELFLKFTCDPEFPVFVVEVEFNVNICELNSLRVAVAAEPELTNEDYLPKLVGLLESSRARLLGCVSDRTVVDLATALRTKLTANVAAWQPYRATQGNRLREEVLRHYIFVIGPVSSLQISNRSRDSLDCFTRGNEAGLLVPKQLDLPDSTDPWKSLLDFVSTDNGLVVAYPRKGFAWPVLPRVHQKTPQYIAAHTVKLQVFCGGRESRRTNEKVQQRAQKTQVRAERWSTKGWSQNYQGKKARK